MLQPHQRDAADQHEDCPAIDDPVQPAGRDNRFARLQHGLRVAHRLARFSFARAPGRKTVATFRDMRQRLGSAPARSKRAGHQIYQRYAASATCWPLKVKPSLPTEIVTFSPSLILPDRINSASGSWTDF